MRIPTRYPGEFGEWRSILPCRTERATFGGSASVAAGDWYVVPGGQPYARLSSINRKNHEPVETRKIARMLDAFQPVLLGAACNSC